MSLQKLLSKISYWVWAIAITLVVIIATYVALGRTFFSAVEVYRPNLEAYLSELLNRQVEIDQLEGRWDRFDPILLVHGASVYGNGEKQPAEQPILRLNRVVIQPDMVASLLRGKLVLNGIELGNVVLTIEQDEKGRWKMAGAAAGEQMSTDWSWSELSDYLASPIIELRDIGLRWKFSDQRVLDWKLPVLTLRANSRGVLASGYIHKNVMSEPMGVFSVNGSGLFSRQGFSGNAYFSWFDSELVSPVLDWFKLEQTQLKEFNSTGAVWSQWERGEVLDITSRFRVEQLRWNAKDYPDASLDLLAARLNFAKVDGAETPENLASWELYVDQIEAIWEGKPLGLSRLSAVVQEMTEPMLAPVLTVSDEALPENGIDSSSVEELSVSGGVSIPLTAKGSDVPPNTANERHQGYGSMVEVRWDQLHLAPLTGVLKSTGLLPEPVVVAMNHYAPSGILQSGVFRFHETEGFDLRAELAEVSVEAFDGAPSAKNLNAFLAVDETSGVVRFASDSLQLGFPELYSREWLFGHGEGEVRWEILQHHTWVTGNNIRLRQLDELDAMVYGGFDLLVADADDIASQFDLAIYAENADARVTPLLTPDKAVAPALYDWLERAVEEGVVRYGYYGFNGEIGKFAGPDSSTSDMYFQVGKGRLQFSPEWPPLGFAEADLGIDDHGMVGTIEQGTLATSTLPRLSFSRVSRSEQSAPLLLSTQLRPSASDWNFWLRESPLAEHTREAAGDWQLSGESTVDLELSLDLETDALMVESTLQLDDMSLASEEFSLQLRNLQGTLNFSSESGIQTNELNGHWNEQPVRIRVDSDRWNAEEKVVLLQGIGELNHTEMLEWLGLPSNFPLRGEADVNLSLQINTTPVSTHLDAVISSDLAELSLDLPAPFIKPPSVAQPLKIRRRWDNREQHGTWRASISPWLDVHLNDGPDGMRRGVVRLGMEGEEALPKDGVVVRGRLPSVSLDRWLEAIQQLQVVEQESASDDVSTRSSDNVKTDIPSWLGETDVVVDKLRWGSKFLRNQRVRVTHLSGEGWRIWLDSPGGASGTVFLPEDDAILPQVKMQTLRVSVDPALDNAVEEEVAVPQEIPAVQVDIKNLIWKGKDYGGWRWSTAPKETGVVFNDLVGTLPAAEFSGRLSWLYDADTNVHTSILTGKLDGSNFETFYRPWGDTSPMTSEAFAFQSSLVWSRPPQDFAWEAVTGNLEFTMDSGVFTEASRTTNIFRVFGILNTDAITRRLRLDFSDLYEQGLAYDQVEGKASIQEGVVHFKEPLAIQAPSSAFKITGTTSLVDDSLNMDMVVVLPLTKNLPLAALLVGAPQVGGALFLIDKLLGDPLSSLTSATYAITGTLQAPQVKLKRIFEDSRRGDNVRRNIED